MARHHSCLFDPLNHIKRELSEIEVTIAHLKEQAVFPGVAQKYANDMLRQLIRRRADLIARMQV